MLIVGLTGSMGMGKSTAAKVFADHGIPVFDADAAVHDLYSNELVAPLAQAFPGAVVNGVVDRKALARLIADDDQALARLEKLVHPLVQRREWEFLRQAHQAGAAMAVLEIPLLFEVGSDKNVDVVLVMTAPPEVQRARVFKRPGMTEAKFQRLMARQMPDAEKRARADIVVDSSGSLAETQAQIERIIAGLEGRQGQAFANWSKLYA